MKTVGIVGCQDRIGTTTQAIQMLLAIRALEYSAAYVELGAKDYIKGLKALYTGIVDAKSHIQVQGIDMYEGGQIIEANKREYDYLIKDYGSITDPGFLKISFLEQDIKVIVAGIKANEIENVEQTLEQNCYEEVNYIFSFVAPDEQQDIKTMMGEHGQHTYFAIYTPNPFEYVEHDIYAYLLA